MTHSDSVTIRELTDEESRELLARNHVGRIAFSFTLQHNQWVAFEVDEVEGPFDWNSVVAHGSFYRLSDESMPHYRELREEALRYIRSFSPATLRKTDPVPDRTEVFAIAIDRITGRAASTTTND